MTQENFDNKTQIKEKKCHSKYYIRREKQKKRKGKEQNEQDYTSLLAETKSACTENSETFGPSSDSFQFLDILSYKAIYLLNKT
jgi:hypothetical protein